MGKSTKDENNKMLLIGGIAILFVVGIYYAVQPDDLQPAILVVDVEVPDNIGVVGITAIACPPDYTVKTHVGGVQGVPPTPYCQAPNPSLETFECGDSLIVDGVTQTIECTTVP